MQAADFIQLVLRGDEGEALRELQKQPALAKARDSSGVSVVCLSVYRRRTELARALAAVRSDLDVFEAVCVGDRARVEQLMDAEGAQVDAVSPDGFSPVGYAAFFGHVDLLRALIARGGRVDVPSRNAMQVCPLHSAAAHSDQVKAVELARIVLEAGADPDARQQGGFTALHEAAANGNVALIELLLARGADAAAATEKGERAVDLARSRGHEAAVRVLERAGA